MTMKELTQSI